MAEPGAKGSRPQVIDQVVNRISEAETGYHSEFQRKVDERYNAYRGVMERRSEAAQWRSKLHPPYAFQVIETITANMVDDQVRFTVRPRPMSTDMEALTRRREAARVVENLLRYQFEVDRFNEKQRPFCLQAAICGLTVAMPYWKYQHGPKTRVRDVADVDNPLFAPDGTAEIHSKRAPESRIEVTHDHPCVEIIDVRDFIWPEGVISVEKAPWLARRMWMTYQELEGLQKAGVYKQVSRLKDAKDQSETISSREPGLYEQRKNKDLIEVLEYWTDDRCVAIGNRDVLLKDAENPFWHAKKPFVVCSGMPYPFEIPGISDVELISELQEMLWTNMNQRTDNLRLLNNAIFAIRDDQEDPESFEWAPGERWAVNGDPNTAVVQFHPDPTPSQISVEAEALIKGDIQNITGGMPFMSGTSSQEMDQQTATGVSIVTNLAQKRLASKKQQYMWAFRRIAEQVLELDQQFLTEAQLVPIVGKDANLDFLRVEPEDVEGEWLVEVNATSDAMMRQERRAEAQALLTTAAQVAPLFAALQVPLNMKAYMEDYLKAFDVQDYERYFTAVPQPIPGAGQPGQQQPPGQPGQPGQGQTNPGLAAGPTSPSNEMSLSPETFMQQFAAMSGGPNNQQ